MSQTLSGDFFEELDKRNTLIRDYILDPRFVYRFHPDEIRWAVTAYVRYGGKRLRPAILMFSAGAVGGDEYKAIPAAAAVEIFHTWTLVHDDIIDRDDIRRGQSTVHNYYRQQSREDRNGGRLTDEEAHHYGVSLAILTGDIQHGWGISMMTELIERGVDPLVTIRLINELDTVVLNTLVEGEVLDIQYAHKPVESLTPSLIEEMLWKKTGALYEFCGRAGAMIGMGGAESPMIEAVAKFAALCGTAFQLQDDILGVIGNQETLGKPVGSDLREGKRTLVVHHAYERANDEQRRFLMKTLGNQTSSDDDIATTIDMMRDLGAIEVVADRAHELIGQAGKHLATLPASRYRELLGRWAEFMIKRQF